MNIVLILSVAAITLSVCLAWFMFVYVQRIRKDLVYTKEELNMTIKSVETELKKLKKEVLKSTYQRNAADASAE